MEQRIRRNKRQSWLLFSIIYLLVILMAIFFAWLYDQVWLVPVIMVAWLIFTLAYLRNINQIIAKSHHGQTVDRKYLRDLRKLDPALAAKAEDLVRTVTNLSIAVGIKTPKIVILPNESLNAFATGTSPDNSLVGITKGLLRRLDKPEIEGVMAHEISHILNYDIRLSTVVFATIGFLAWLGYLVHLGRSRDKPPQLIALVILANFIVIPFVTAIIRLAISRRREYLADASGAYITRNPRGLASALAKIQKYGSNVGQADKAAAHFFLSEPRKSFAASLSTHPPMEKRIEILNNLEREGL